MLVEPLSFEEQFKLKYSRSASSRPSVSTIQITDTIKVGTPTKETKEMDRTKTTLFSGCRSAFTENTNMYYSSWMSKGLMWVQVLH